MFILGFVMLLVGGAAAFLGGQEDSLFIFGCGMALVLIGSALWRDI